MSERPAGGDRERHLLEDIEDLTARAAARAERDRAEWRQGELRPAAVLFLDVIGFTSLSRVLSPEQLATLIDRTFQLLAIDCEAQGGVLDKVIGDAALFVFAGSPDHPPPREAALRAGLAILSRIEAVSTALAAQDLALGVRVGVSFGEVARQKVGGEETTLTVMGETVNLAQRLESNAPHGALLTVPAVVEGLEGVFSWEDHATLDLKGFGDTPTLRVLATTDSPRLRSSAARLTPLIGRDTEVEDALSAIAEWGETAYQGDLLDPVATGERVAKRGRLLVFSGDAAVGKSRLAWEVAQALRDQGTTLATAHALQSGGGLLAFTRELARLGGLPQDGLVAAFEALLSTAKDAMGEEYAERQRRHLPVLAFLLQSPDVDTSGIAKADPGTFATAARLALRSLAELVHHSLPQGRPVVLVIEDLQWLADLQDLIGDLLATTALRSPLVVVGTARPEWSFPEEWEDSCEWREISLSPLPLPLAKALVQARLPGLELPDDLWTRVLDKAEGIPYYLEEFANVLADKGYAEEDEAGTWSLTHPPDQIDVPDDVVALVLSRLDLLPQDQKDLTGKAAVLGRAFLTELLHAVEERLDDGHPDSLPPLLNALGQAGIVHPEDDADSPTPDRYLFTHLLTRDAAYQSLLKHNRTLLHKLAADSLLALHPEGTAGELDARLAASDHYKHAGLQWEELEQRAAILSTLVAGGGGSRWDPQWERARTLLESCRPSGTVKEEPWPGVWDAPQGLEWIPPQFERQGDVARALMAVEMARSASQLALRKGDQETARDWVGALTAHPVLGKR